MRCWLTWRGKPAARRERELHEAALTVPCRERDVESSVEAKAQSKDVAAALAIAAKAAIVAREFLIVLSELLTTSPHKTTDASENKLLQQSQLQNWCRVPLLQTTQEY